MPKPPSKQQQQQQQQQQNFNTNNNEKGNVTLDLSVDGKPIGQSFLNELVLKPGDNNLEMSAKTDLMAVTKLLPKYKNNIIPVDITGNSTTYNGQDLPYFAAALAANKLQVDLDVGEILKGVD